MAVGPGHAGVSGVQAPSLLRTAGGWALGPGGRTPYLRRGSPLGPFRWGRGARWAPLDLEPSRAESKLAQRSRPCLSGPFGSLPRPGASSRCGAPLRTRRGAPAPGAEPAARRAAVPRPGGRRNPRAAAGPEPGGAQGTGRPAARPLHKARPCSGPRMRALGPDLPGSPASRARCRASRPRRQGDVQPAADAGGNSAVLGLLGPCPGLGAALDGRAPTLLAWAPSRWVTGTRHLRRRCRCPCHGDAHGGRGWGAGGGGAEEDHLGASCFDFVFLSEPSSARLLRGGRSQHIPAHLPSLRHVLLAHLPRPTTRSGCPLPTPGREPQSTRAARPLTLRGVGAGGAWLTLPQLLPMGSGPSARCSDLASVHRASSPRWVPGTVPNAVNT